MEKGKTNNPNGRPKGTPNKVTSTIRNWIVELINDNREQIKQDLKSLKPCERLDFISKLLPYILPKVEKANEVEGAAYTMEDVVEEMKEEFDWSTSKKQVKNWYEKE